MSQAKEDGQRQGRGCRRVMDSEEEQEKRKKGELTRVGDRKTK